MKIYLLLKSGKIYTMALEMRLVSAVARATEQAISDFFNEGISKIDKALDFLHSQLAKDIARVVLEYKDNELPLTYSVRSDCAPLFFTKSE